MTAIPIEITYLILSYARRKELRRKALKKAREVGISGRRWREWANGREAVRDLAMIADPQSERQNYKLNFKQHKKMRWQEPTDDLEA